MDKPLSKVVADTDVKALFDRIEQEQGALRPYSSITTSPTKPAGRH